MSNRPEASCCSADNSFDNNSFSVLIASNNDILSQGLRQEKNFVYNAESSLNLRAAVFLNFAIFALTLAPLPLRAADRIRVGFSAISLANGPVWIAEEKNFLRNMTSKTKRSWSVAAPLVRPAR